MNTNTLTAYRITSPRWATTAFSGEGARKYGGRWNSPGHPVVYLSQSRALAALELLVHLTTPESRAKRFVLIELTLPSQSCTSLSSPDLPNDWRQSPPTRSTLDTGNRWLTQNRSLALQVPSAIIPQESNLLLNVSHPAFGEIHIGEPTPFTFDQRLS